jgi:hypothetical protein
MNEKIHAYWLGANIQFAACAILNKDPQVAAKELADAIGHAQALRVSRQLVYSLEEVKKAIQDNAYTPITCIEHIHRLGRFVGKELAQQRPTIMPGPPTGPATQHFRGPDWAMSLDAEGHFVCGGPIGNGGL